MIRIRSQKLTFLVGKLTKLSQSLGTYKFSKLLFHMKVYKSKLHPFVGKYKCSIIKIVSFCGKVYFLKLFSVENI
jgi:hypothetical protein